LRKNFNDSIEEAKGAIYKYWNVEYFNVMVKYIELNPREEYNKAKMYAFNYAIDYFGTYGLHSEELQWCCKDVIEGVKRNVPCSKPMLTA
jgi:hypothetical protein